MRSTRKLRDTLLHRISYTDNEKKKYSVSIRHQTVEKVTKHFFLRNFLIKRPYDDVMTV